ncbi:MAG TPA: 50S ribosomal protein L15 [Phycisphaerae bacterium]|nr:50S ribosomal protein L15 [Phycisphaerae bacterium]HRY67835.1 50S ribosomal protein L15 [Phycisphaerae bacterium]HSA25288.1 50S ribosomal protein L15 [Phycisphaerae bacterium]
MMITDVTSKAGAKHRAKRLGRGVGSGRGKTAGRGTKGAGAHSSHGAKPLSEGGQTQLFRRLPKRGFSNFSFRTEYQVVNVGTLEDRFEANTHVTPDLLKSVGLIHDPKAPVKILGDGQIGKKLRVEATCFSASAVKKITEAGGQTTVIGK